MSTRSVMEKEELFLASCKQGDYTQFYKLYRSGLDVNMRGGEALREAITNSHVMIWTLLLDCPGINLNLKDENGRTALHVACWYNKETAVAKLISTSGVSGLNEKDLHGNTPIMMAAKYASKENIRNILKYFLYWLVRDTILVIFEYSC